MEATQVTASCQVCRGRLYLISRQGDWAVAEVCPCAQPCRRCGGNGYVLAEQTETFSQKVGQRKYQVVAPCSCRLLKGRVATYSRAAIPGILHRAQFDNYREYHDTQARAKKVCTTFALGYSRRTPTKGFILSGPVGTGKTHLLVSALTHLVLEVGVEVRYVEMSLLYAEIRKGFRQGKSGGEIIGQLSDVEVLAIDELGKGRGSPFELETMDELIARRYNANRTTLFATNYPLEKAAPAARSYYESDDLKRAGKDESLVDRVGERIYSRLCEMCDFVDLAGAPDRRRSHRDVETTHASYQRPRR